MSITAAIVLFVMLWFLCLFVALPIGIRTQEEDGEVVPGTPGSAPVAPMLGKKMFWATLGAIVLWSASYYLVVYSSLTMADLDVWGRM